MTKQEIENTTTEEIIRTLGLIAAVIKTINERIKNLEQQLGQGK